MTAKTQAIRYRGALLQRRARAERRLATAKTAPQIEFELATGKISSRNCEQVSMSMKPRCTSFRKEATGAIKGRLFTVGCSSRGVDLEKLKNRRVGGAYFNPWHNRERGLLIRQDAELEGR